MGMAPADVLAIVNGTQSQSAATGGGTGGAPATPSGGEAASSQGGQTAASSISARIREAALTAGAWFGWAVLAVVLAHAGRKRGGGGGGGGG